MPSLRDEVRPLDNERRNSAEINGVGMDELLWALRSVNLEAHRLPQLTDFGFDEQDFRAYRQRVRIDAAELDSVGEEDFFRYDYPFAPTADRRDIFLALPDMIDTIPPYVVAMALLNSKDRWGSTTSNSFDVALVNEVGDTLRCSFVTSGPDQPYNLPWTIRYGEAEFHTFNAELASLLMQLLPEEGQRDERVDKVNLLYAVAWYLGELRDRASSEMK